MRYIPSFLSLLLLLLAGEARAQNIIVAQGLWCNTPEQLEVVYNLVNVEGKEFPAALDVVNAGKATPECAIGRVAIVVGAKIKTLKVKGTTYDIFKVAVLAFHNGATMIQLPAPMLQYGAKFVSKDTEA